jgi:hypothetical protein
LLIPIIESAISAIIIAKNASILPLIVPIVRIKISFMRLNAISTVYKGFLQIPLIEYVINVMITVNNV